MLLLPCQERSVVENNLGIPDGIAVVARERFVLVLFPTVGYQEVCRARNRIFGILKIDEGIAVPVDAVIHERVGHELHNAHRASVGTFDVVAVEIGSQAVLRKRGQPFSFQAPVFSALLVVQARVDGIKRGRIASVLAEFRFDGDNARDDLVGHATLPHVVEGFPVGGDEVFPAQDETGRVDLPLDQRPVGCAVGDTLFRKDFTTAISEDLIYFFLLKTRIDQLALNVCQAHIFNR